MTVPDQVVPLPGPAVPPPQPVAPPPQPVAAPHPVALARVALGDVADWLVVLSALALLGVCALNGLTFMPAAGFLANEVQLLWFERAALVIGAGAGIRRLMGGRVLPGAPLWGLAALTLLCLVTFLHTTDLYATREEVFFLASVAVLILSVLISLNDPLKTRAVISGLALIALTEALIGLYQYARGPATPSYWLSQAFAGVIRARAYGTLGSPNVLAGFLLLGIAVAAILALSGPRLWRVASGAALAVLVVSLVLTYSRGGYLGLAAFTLAAAVLWWPIRRNAWPVLLLIALVAAGAVAGLPAVGLRAQSIAPAQEDTATSRRFIWNTALGMWRAHRLWGTGIGTFNSAYSPYRPRGVLATYAMLAIPGSAHDDYLQILAELGLSGASLLGLAGLYGLWRAGRRYAGGGLDERLWLGAWGASLAGIGATSLVDENLYVVTNLVMLAIFAAAVSAHVSLRDRPWLGIGRRLLVLPLAAVLLTLPPLLATPVRGTLLHEEATSHVKRGEYRQAVISFQNALAADPLNGVPPAYFGDLLADMYIRHITNRMGPWQTMRDRAEELYWLAMRLNPWSAYPHAELGRLRRLEGRYPEASVALHEAVQLDPYSPRYRLWLGEVFLAAGDRAAARVQLQEAVRLYPVELLVIKHHEGWSARFSASLLDLEKAKSELRTLDTPER